MFVTTNCLLQQFLDLVIDVLGGEAEFLVEDFVRSREADGVETPYSAVFAYKAFQRARQTCGHTETLDTLREDGVLVFFGLLAEETFGWHADNLQTDTLCAQ